MLNAKGKRRRLDNGPLNVVAVAEDDIEDEEDDDGEDEDEKNAECCRSALLIILAFQASPNMSKPRFLEF
jgi:hypothetical protein